MESKVRSISGNLRIDTPQGVAEARFNVNVTKGYGIFTDLFGQFLNSSGIKPSITIESKSSASKYRREMALFIQRKRFEDPIFDLIPPEEEGLVATRTVHALRRFQIAETVEDLAGLDINSLPKRTGFFGPKTIEFIKHLQELAQQKIQ